MEIYFSPYPEILLSDIGELSMNDKNPFKEKPSVSVAKTTEKIILKTINRTKPVPADEKNAVTESLSVLLEIIIAENARTPVIKIPIVPSQNHNRSESVIPIKT